MTWRGTRNRHHHAIEHSKDRQVKAVQGLFEAGLIRHWGRSNETAYGVTMFCLTCDRLGVPRPVSVQNDFKGLCAGWKSIGCVGSFSSSGEEPASPRHRANAP